MGLRYYQREAVDAVFGYWSRTPGNPLVDMATGVGKSKTAGTLTTDLLRGWGDLRVMSATHVVELVEGNYKELLGIDPFIRAGVWAASMGLRDKNAQVLFAQLQTVWNRAAEIGWVDVLIIDEAHLVPFKAATMYRKLIDALRAINPDMKVVGFTATPYRLDGGSLVLGDDRLFDEVVYEYGIRRGIDDGYLTPLSSKPLSTKYDMTGVGRSMGEYKASDYREAVDSDRLNKLVVEEALDTEGHRKCALIFCRGLEHVERMRDAFRRAGRKVGMVTGKTPATERRRLIEALKVGELWGLVNDNILSTGTNIVRADLIVDCYRTMSAGRYAQRGGRGTRVVWPWGFDPESTDAAGRRAAIAGGSKPNCRYMDFAGNIDEHGPLDMIQPKQPGKGKGEAPIKLCPQCDEILSAAARVCSCCGLEFVFEEKPRYEAKASNAPILSTDELPWSDVTGRRFVEHPPKEGKPPSVKTVYTLGLKQVNDWLCPEHGGGAGARAGRYWKNHGGKFPYPKTVSEWLDRAGELAITEAVQLKKNGKYLNVQAWRAGVVGGVVSWRSGEAVSEGDRRSSKGNEYCALNSGMTGVIAPEGPMKSVSDLGVEWRFVRSLPDVPGAVAANDNSESRAAA